MSFISVFTTDKFTSIMCDGRVYNAITKQIVDEDFEKIRQYGNFVIGVVGNPGILDTFEKNLHLINHSFDYNSINELLKALFSMKIYQDDGNLAYAHAVLTGRNLKGNFFVNVYSNLEPEVDKLNYECNIQDRMNFITLPPSDCKIDANSVVRLLYRGDNSEDKIVQMQKTLNDVISDNAISVNKNTFNLVLY